METGAQVGFRDLHLLVLPHRLLTSLLLTQTHCSHLAREAEN